MEILTFSVPQEYDGALVKSFLRGGCGVSSHLLIQCKRQKNGIAVNGVQKKVIDRVSAGDVVTLTLPEDQNSVPPQALSVPIVWEDSHLIILNKPAGMPVHPCPGHDDGTLANFVAHQMKETGERYSFRPLNRLDKDTSGLVIGAKNAYAAAALKNEVSKEYLAVCQGILKGSGIFSQPIRLKEGHSIQRETGEGGQTAITHWQALESGQGHTLLCLRLETGRTHQIRVHCSAAGYPLAGDDMYGGSRQHMNRQALHCFSAEFLHPVEKIKIAVTAPVPEDFLQLLKRFGIHNPVA